MRRKWSRIEHYDPNNLKRRLAIAHESAKKANETIAGLMATIADQKKQIELRDRVIATLRSVVEEYRDESLADAHLRSL